jgi:hypothetical protein
MIAGDAGTVMTLRDEAHNLALRLNNGEPGILAGPDAPGCMLENMSAAEAEVIPRWGQRGSFTIEVQDMRVRIEMEGLFGIGSRHCPWMNFSAHAVDWDKPFLSETGNRSSWVCIPNSCRARRRTHSQPMSSPIMSRAI